VSDGPLLQVEDLRTLFRQGGGLFGRGVEVKAVDCVSFSMTRGEVLGLVGESGSGKTTTGRSILRLVEPTSGKIRFDGEDVLKLQGAGLRRFRRRAQIVFQDPFSSLNPRMTVARVIAEPMYVQDSLPKAKRLDRVAQLLEMVGLAPEMMTRYPHQFSGGQRQRVAIARALALEPQFLVADEPVSALDVSVQAQMINLMLRLTRDLGLTMLFIAHDLAVVEYIADRIAVMYLGRIVEIAPAKGFASRARHPYSRALLSAVPVPDPAARHEPRLLQGEIPSAVDPPSGCVFRTRCPFVLPECAAAVPSFRSTGPRQVTACIRSDIGSAADPFPEARLETTTRAS
jgi:oligopeptide/dipeptide ABC transporter ATP-binding protein